MTDLHAQKLLMRYFTLLKQVHVGKTDHIEESKWSEIDKNWRAALIESFGVGHSFVHCFEKVYEELSSSIVCRLLKHSWLAEK